MAIQVESTSNRILVIINDNNGPFILQRADYLDREWKTWTRNGFAILPEERIETLEENEGEPLEALPIDSGDFIDSFDLKDGLYEYRYVSASIENPDGLKDYVYSTWVKYGSPSAIGYSFNNYHSPEGKWGTVVTPDDCRFTYLWGTDTKATNGQYFTDEQIQFFIDEATRYVERQLNISIVKSVIRSQAEDRGMIKGVDYDEEEPYYDFTFRKIQRYGMIQTKHRPILNVEKCELLNKGGSNIDLLEKNVAIDRRQGVIKFTTRPFMPSDTSRGISTAISRYGSETLQPHLFYLIDYTVGYKNSDDVPADLRQIIGKVAAISLLNVIGDGLMAGFSSSSLSMDGISESFSSTQSATSATYGARIAVYQKEVENYFKENKYRFGFLPIGAL